VAAALRVALVAVGAAALAVLLFPAYLSFRAAGSKILEPQQFDFVLIALGAFCIGVGIQLVPWKRTTSSVVLGLLTGAGLLFGIMGMFSIGLPFLVASLVVLVVLYRTLRRSPARTQAGAAIGGALIGYALVLLFIGQGVPPVVECLPNGGSSSSGRWLGGRAVTLGGGMRMGADGSMTGTIEAPAWTATFRCEGGRMVEFQRTPR
jgi:hypothetical protein